MQDQTTGSASPSFLPAATSHQRSFGSLVSLSMRRPGGRHAVSALIVVVFGVLIIISEKVRAA